MEKAVFERICAELREIIGKENLPHLPKTYEFIGDILIIFLSDILTPWQNEIGEVYLRNFPQAKTVMRKGRIVGEYRVPRYGHLAGNGTETVHKENGILYSLDLAEVMFSSGNIEERQRMARIVSADETITDMFAGIGYFTLPMAYHGRAQVTALEKNPAAFHYLEKNIALNTVEDRVTAHCMDCREYTGIGDRVVMGYIQTTHKFLEKAFTLTKKGGIIHYHQTVVEKNYPDALTAEIDAVTEEYDLLAVHPVKKFAPGVWHVVADIRKA
jgi:tRNA wybutosine-synthesizing protein 2